jgi:DNA-binding response OmpR family regulator
MKMQEWGDPGPRTALTDELISTSADRTMLSNKRCQAILLVSDDADFFQRMRDAANAGGQWIVRTASLKGAVPVLRAVQPGAVLLDLDLTGGHAWSVAESLLSEPGCPLVLLLTARREQFDEYSAFRAGSLLSKTVEPSHLLDLVAENLDTASNQAERNEIQRVLIHWLRPSNWSVPVTPSHRFWGINE